MARISLKTLCTALILILLVLLLYLSRSPSPMEQVLVLSKADPYKTVAKKMEQKMIEESERNAKKLLKLPNPKEIIKNAKGPLTKKKSKMPIMERLALLLDSMKCSKQIPNRDLLMILGRPNSGLEQFLPSIHKKHGVFILQDNTPMTSVKEVMYSLTNLSRCAILTKSKLSQETLEDFPLKHNPYIVNSCDEECVTSPDLWTKLCQKFNFKALNFENFDLNIVKNILEDLTLDAIYLTRDPRAMIHAKMSTNPGLDFAQEASKLCENLTKDLNVIDHKMPKYHFYTLRFEDFQLKSNEDVTNYLKGFHNLSTFCSKQDPEENVLSLKADKISLDAWKLKLSMEEIMIVEDKCGSVLNRLEYPIYGSNFLNE